MISVYKIGGKVIDDEAALGQFCRDFAALEGPKILVHGGGVEASRLQQKLGMQPVMIEGRRVTDEATLRIVTMVYAGWCSKHICALLQARGCNAVGMAGCDASVIKASRRAPLEEGTCKGIDFGFVGDVNAGSVNTEILGKLLEAGLVPVLCAINHDGNGNLLNTNADTVAQSVAAALRGKLYCCFEQKGVLRDSVVIGHIGPEEFESLKADGTVSGGMIPKIENCLKALREGAAGARILSYEDIGREDAGTSISL